MQDADVTYIPCSGLTGENLVTKSSVPELIAWYKGTTLLEAIGILSIIIPSRYVVFYLDFVQTLVRSIIYVFHYSKEPCSIAFHQTTQNVFINIIP